MTFATFLYVLFASSIHKRRFIPSLSNVGNTPYAFVMNFLDACKPATNQDLAKVLVWSFMAGYLERFVPNIISQIQSDS
jgi:hypothetical protein